MNVSFSNKYFDCVIENKRFRIVESSTKPTGSHAAIVTLEKIDFILKNKLTYEPSFNDNFSKYTQDQLYNILKEKAVHIKKGFQEKEAKQGLPIKNEPKVNSILTRIENSLNPPSVLPLHNDVTHEIATHLELADLARFAQVNHHGRKHAILAFIERAQKFGFTGDNNINATKYLNNLVNEIKIINKEGIISQKYLETNKGTENILLNLMNSLSSEDLFKILSNPNTYSKYFLTSFPFLLKCVNECLKNSPSQVGNINLRNAEGETPLVLAVNNNKIEMVKVLLEHGVDPNISSNDHTTPLHKASFKGYTDIAGLLLKHGAKIDFRNVKGDTPLMIAAKLGKKEMVQFLLENGADANIRTDITHKSSALMWAICNGYTDIVGLLIKHGANIDLQNLMGSTPLHYAIIGNSKVTTRLLLEHGANPNIMGGINLYAPLHLASRNGNFELVEMLIKYDKTDINLQNGNGETALLLAMKSLSPSIIRLLINHGATL